MKSYFLLKILCTVFIAFIIFASCSYDDCLDLTKKTELIKIQLNHFSKGDIPSF